MRSTMSEVKASQLIGEKASLYEQVTCIHKKMVKARNLFRSYEERYYKTKCEFEKVDRELAMIDGRYQVLDPPDKRKVKKVELTSEQILELAARLGIEIKEEDDEEETDNDID